MSGSTGEKALRREVSCMEEEEESVEGGVQREVS